MDPLTIGAIAQGVVEGGKALFGASQRKRARKALSDLQDERKLHQYIPSAVVQRAAEPIAEKFMEAQEMGAQRRTAQSMNALGQAGSRGLIGGLPQVLESERVGEQQRAGMYEQERIAANAALASAQENLRREQRQDWQNQVAAQGAELGAGQQNIFSGLSGIGEAALFAGMGSLFKKGVDKIPDADRTILAPGEIPSEVLNDPALEEAGVDMDFGSKGPVTPPDFGGNKTSGSSKLPSGDVSGGMGKLPTEGLPEVGMDEEEGEDMTLKNPFELPNGGLRVPLPTGGTIDIPPQKMGDIFDNGDGTMTIPTPKGRFRVPKFKIGSTKGGGVVPTPVGTFRF